MMMKRGMVDKQGESMVAWLPAIGTWGYPIRAYKMLGSNECDVSVWHPASFQFIRRIPALYILRPKENLRQLESTLFSK